MFTNLNTNLHLKKTIKFLKTNYNSIPLTTKTHQSSHTNRPTAKILYLPRNSRQTQQAVNKHVYLCHQKMFTTSDRDATPRVTERAAAGRRYGRESTCSPEARSRPKTNEFSGKNMTFSALLVNNFVGGIDFHSWNFCICDNSRLDNDIIFIIEKYIMVDPLFGFSMIFSFLTMREYLIMFAKWCVVVIRTGDSWEYFQLTIVTKFKFGHDDNRNWNVF